MLIRNAGKSSKMKLKSKNKLIEIMCTLTLYVFSAGAMLKYSKTDKAYIQLVVNLGQ